MSREERICWEQVSKQVHAHLLLLDSTHGVAEGIHTGDQRLQGRLVFGKHQYLEFKVTAG